MKRHILIAVSFLVVLGLSLGIPTIQAQTYPNRPVQLVIPGTPGSIIDITGRVLAEDMGKILGAQFVPMNKPGGGFTLGTDFVVRSKKDGYTLSYTNNPAIVYSRILSPDTVPYVPDRDLEPLGLHLFFPHALAVQASAPWKTFGELVDYAKKNPDQVRCSTPGIGSTTHFHLEILQSLTGAKFNHIPFKSGESVITALLGGHVEMTFDAVSKIAPHVESGKMRMLLVTMKSPVFPAIPTLRELGYKQDLAISWFAMYGPVGMPEEVKKTLIPAIQKAVNIPESKAKIEKLYFIVDYKSPAEQKKLAAEEYETALGIAKKIGLYKK